jgi:hypothetical protein
MRYLVLAILFLTPFFSFAQSPSVDSFTVSPTVIKSGSPVYFSWTLSNAGGYSFTPLCSSGIRFKNAGGSIIPCDTAITSVTETGGSLTLYVVNTSGSTRSVQARLTPKNSSGQDDTGASKTVSFSVETDPEPITSFTSSVSTSEPGQSLTISWSAHDLTGVNLKIECKNEIKVSSPSYTASAFIPCDKIIFSPDLAINGTLVLNFTNSSVSKLPYTLTLLPEYEDGAYDGTHAKTITLDIASDVLPAPVINFFNASSTAIFSGDGVNFSWNIQNAAGANLQLSCVSGLSATSSKDPTVILPCAKPAFSEDLSAKGTVALYFLSKDELRHSITITLLPAKKAGEYDATLAKSITLYVDPPKQSASELSSSSTPILIPSSPLSSSAPLPKHASSSVPSASSVSSPSPSSVPIPKQKPATLPSPVILPQQSTPENKEKGEISPEEEKTSLPDLSSDEKKQSPLLLSQEAEAAISKTLLDKKVLEEIERITPKTINENAQEFETYEAVGFRQVKLFYFIPVKMRLTAEVRKDGEVLNIRKPWWSFFAR